ncbi:MAG: NAD(P)(+) transhydrogenase (Re/Si-specific) subunit alpha, partial [Planctomycetes bacterium]|nr:NAD(P)(+) transhydrogenase (Re/Si-specific) subunit alpha [Planctomycetota bacterium]
MAVAFIPKETHGTETRVAGTPDTVKALVKAGLQVQVQSGAGSSAGFPDDEFTAAGASIVTDAAAARGGADLVLGIHVPPPAECKQLKRGAMLVCGMQPLLQLDSVAALRDAGVQAFAMDLMPRITRAQKMDILSPQATCGGYQAVLLAAVHLPKLFPLMMTAAGTITPA